MEKTANYKLNQWELTDRVKMEDFNADNQRVEAALTSQSAMLAEHAAQLAKRGNCRIVWGSYTGSGTFGADNPNTLSFEAKPLLLAIMPSTNSGSSAHGFLAVRGSTFTYTHPEYFNSINQVTWTNRGAAWYCAANADYQFNSGGMVFYYVALLTPEE